jgi:predicted dehydrogenase
MINNIDELIYKPEMPKLLTQHKIMIVGAGEIIKDAQLPAYKLAGYEVHGIYNRTIEKAEHLAKEFNIPKVYGNLDKFIEEGKRINAIYDIALPASKMIEILNKFPKGAAILMQKPMGENIDEATKIIKICREKQFVAGVNFQLRQAPYIVAAKQLIDAGKIGEICDFEFRSTVYTPWNLWDFLFKLERMEINYHSIHFIDTMRYFLGDPKSVYCKTMKHPKSKELAQVKSDMIFNYGDYLRANIITNHNHEFGEEEKESFLKIEGTKGCIKIIIGVYLDYPKGKPDKFKYILLDDNKGWRELNVPGSWFPEAFIGTMGGLMCKLDNPDFNYINSAEEAYKTMCLVEACYASDAQGGYPVDYHNEIIEN